MRRILSLVIFVFVYGVCFGSITKTAARQIVMDEIVGTDSLIVNVYMEPMQYTAEFYELESATKISNPFSSSWIFLIDDYPNANWNHDC